VAESRIEDLGRLPFFDGTSRPVGRVRSDVYGDLWAPEDFTQLAALLEFIASQVDAVAWRGQSDIGWRSDCGAVRRLLLAGLEAIEPNLSDEVTAPIDRHSIELGAALNNYERELIDQARLGGHDHGAGGRLSDFEMLATLQHHGAATRFLDFTRNLFVALWFASTPVDDGWGLVVGVRRMTEGPIDIPGTDVQQRSAQEVLDKYSGRLALWRPAPLVPRIIAQQSVLICSPLGDNPWGSFGVPLANQEPELEPVSPGRLGTVGRDLIAFAVPPALKAVLRQGGRDILGYDTSSMFPDVDGFCRWHAATASLDREMHRQLSGL
jgi:hypothetical protein